MPQPFNNAVITNAGARLLTRAQAGDIRIEFTRIAVGDGFYSDSEKEIHSLQGQESLKSPKNRYPISSMGIFSEHSVKLTALITNQDFATGETLVDEGYYINEIGLYAKEKDAEISTEVLYSIAITSGENGDFMPPYNGFNPAQIIQEYYVTVSNSAEVFIHSVEGTFALADDVQEMIFKIQVIEKQLSNLSLVREITEAEIVEWYGQVGGSTDVPGEDYITVAEIDAMYASNPNYGEGDVGLPDSEINEMYEEDPDYGELDVGIPDSEIDGMYQ